MADQPEPEQKAGPKKDRRWPRGSAFDKLLKKAASLRQSGGGRQTEEWVVRAVVLALFAVAVCFVVALDVPIDKQGDPKLPSVALGSESVYRVEVLLALVYGGLLLLTPLFYGVVRGRLPTEISHRGAKWAEAADETLAAQQAAIERLQKDLTGIRAQLVEIELARDEE